MACTCFISATVTLWLSVLTFCFYLNCTYTCMTLPPLPLGGAGDHALSGPGLPQPGHRPLHLLWRSLHRETRRRDAQTPRQPGRLHPELTFGVCPGVGGRDGDRESYGEDSGGHHGSQREEPRLLAEDTPFLSSVTTFWERYDVDNKYTCMHVHTRARTVQTNSRAGKSLLEYDFRVTFIANSSR